MSPPYVAAIIAAAGAGRRLTADVRPDEAVPPLPKALQSLGGEPMLRHAVRAVEDHVAEVVVAAPSALVAVAQEAIASSPVRTVVVPGGATRQESVRRALDQVHHATDFVLVHDAARPLVPSAVVARVVTALQAGSAVVVPVVQVSDSLRWVVDDGDSTVLDRSRVRAVQTPQGFRLATLRAAHAAAGAAEVTDDASLAAGLGEQVTLVDGDVRGFKVTHALDVALAEVLLSRR